MQNIKFENSNQYPEAQQCSHPKLVKEFAYGAPTGNFICLQCECLIPPTLKQRVKVQITPFNMAKQSNSGLNQPTCLA